MTSGSEFTDYLSNNPCFYDITNRFRYILLLVNKSESRKKWISLVKKERFYQLRKDIKIRSFANKYIIRMEKHYFNEWKNKRFDGYFLQGILDDIMKNSLKNIIQNITPSLPPKEEGILGDMDGFLDDVLLSNIPTTLNPHLNYIKPFDFSAIEGRLMSTFDDSLRRGCHGVLIPPRIGISSQQDAPKE